MPPHQDVKEGLALLKDAGFRLATLTNSPVKTLQQQLQHNDLYNYFVDPLSVEEFQMYKPHVEVYKRALAKLQVQPGEALLVATHGWDIAGALAAGMQAGFVKRKGQSLYPLAPKPHFQGKDIKEIAKTLIQSQKASQS